MKMSTWKSDEETVNWTKGCTGLVVTKIGLSQSLIKRWKTHLYSWDEEELSHLPEFFKDAEEKRITYKWEKDTNNERKGFWRIDCECPSGMCQKILDRLLNLHVNPKSQNIVWNPYEEPNKRNKLDQYKLNRRDIYVPYHPEKCSVCREKNCPFERNRKGIALSKNQADDDVDKYYWKIANMFMFHGKERNSIENTGPEDTDSALIFKMMKNCKLFTFDNQDESENEDDNDDKDDEDNHDNENEDEADNETYKKEGDENGKEDDDDFKDDDESKIEADNETYNELLEVRNFLMHTSDNRLSDEALAECFTRMKTILRAKKFNKDNFCKKAVKELTQLESMVIIMTLLTSREANIVKRAFAEQHSALTYDISLKGNLKSDHVLEGLLHISDKKYRRYTIQKSSVMPDIQETLRTRQRSREEVLNYLQETQRPRQKSSEEVLMPDIPETLRTRQKSSEELQKDIQATLRPRQKSSEDVLKPDIEETLRLRKRDDVSGELKNLELPSLDVGPVVRGTATGAFVGSIAGPVGTVIGGVVGGFLGNFFK